MAYFNVLCHNLNVGDHKENKNLRKSGLRDDIRTGDLRNTSQDC